MPVTAHLGCGRAATLFYEPDGLLLRSCLVPASQDHSEHLLTFQLGYLGPGDITVHVALEASASDGGHPDPTAVLLQGRDSAAEGPVAGRQMPGVWLSYTFVPDGPVNCRFVVWGQPGGSDTGLCGELTTTVCGSLPLLTARTRASVGYRPASASAGWAGDPRDDWWPAGAGPGSSGCQFRADGLIRNSRT